MTLKQIIILIIVFVSFNNLSAQSPEFKAEWAKTEKLIKQFDSLANFVQKQRIFFKSRRQKLKFYNPYNKSITHKVIIKYKNGNIIARHIYRAERKIKIKMLIVNGKKVFIKSKFKKAINSPKSYLFENGPKISNRFINIGNNTWYWTRKINDIDQPAKLEIINNWQ